MKKQSGGFKMPELLNVGEAAKEMKISIPTLRQWLYQKRLPYVHLGRRVLLRREDIEDFVKKNLVEAKVRV
jgi:excisionase family DNA binding protein